MVRVERPLAKVAKKLNRLGLGASVQGLAGQEFLALNVGESQMQVPAGSWLFRLRGVWATGDDMEIGRLGLEATR